MLGIFGAFIFLVSKTKKKLVFHEDGVYIIYYLSKPRKVRPIRVFTTKPDRRTLVKFKYEEAGRSKPKIVRLRSEFDDKEDFLELYTHFKGKMTFLKTFVKEFVKI